MYDEKFFGYFEQLRTTLVNILNEIVDNYKYIKPDEDEKI